MSAGIFRPAAEKIVSGGFGMSKNRVRVSVCGNDYVITGDESEEYVRELAREVERRMEELMNASSCVSVTMAAVLTAMNCCDDESKAIMSADNLRAQMKEYLADSARCRSEAEESRRELERLRAELRKTQRQLDELREAATAAREAKENKENASAEKSAEDEQLRLEATAPVTPPQMSGTRPKEISAGEFMSLFDALHKEEPEKNPPQ